MSCYTSFSSLYRPLSYPILVRILPHHRYIDTYRAILDSLPTIVLILCLFSVSFNQTRPKKNLFQKLRLHTMKENHNYLLHKRLKPIRIIDLSRLQYNIEILLQCQSSSLFTILYNSSKPIVIFSRSCSLISLKILVINSIIKFFKTLLF